MSGERFSTKKVCVLGHSLDLPCLDDLRPEQTAIDRFIQILENKEIQIFNLLERGFLRHCDVSEEGNPWLLQQVYGHRRMVDNLGDIDLVLTQIGEKENLFMDSFQCICLSRVWRALECCGIPISLLHGSRTGIFVAGSSIFGVFESYPDESSLRGSLNSSLSDRVAYFLGTHGPSITLETACSSGLTALSLATDSIKNGSSNVAIVVGINYASKEYEIALQATGVLSKSGQCRPFDEHADGTVGCQGSGCIIIASLEWARENGFEDIIKCVILNSTIGSAGVAPNVRQGSGRVYEQPNAAGMIEMIRLCHEV